MPGMSRREALALLAAGVVAPHSTAVSAQTATDAHWLSVSDIGLLIRARTLSSTVLTEQMLDRIKRLDPVFESYATLMADAALDAARAADREIAAGTDRGPLHGVPIAVKDLCHTRGVRTMGRNVRERRIRSERRRYRRRQAARRGRGPAREAESHGRRDGRVSPREGHSAKPVGHQSLAGPFVEWIGGRARRRAVLCRHRHRHRRFNPLSLVCQRGRRTKAHVRTCEPPRRDGVVRNTRSCRSDGPNREGRRDQ